MIIMDGVLRVIERQQVCIYVRTTTKFHICQPPILVVFFLKFLHILLIRIQDSGASG